MKNFDLDKDKKINTGFKIPENYFEEFENQLMQRISFEETTPKISAGFKTPDNYFESFEDRVMQSISFEENTEKITTGFKIPENYFENFEDRIISKIQSEEKPVKVISLWQRRSIWISGIAATMILSLGAYIYFNELNTQNNITAQEYLAYSSDLSTYEIANELTDAEITKLENELVLLDKNETEKYVNEYLN